MTVQQQASEAKKIEALFFVDFPNAHVPEILEEIYLKHIYAPFLLGKKDLTIVDCGANVGMFSYYAKDYAKRIIALEPSSMHRTTMQAMLDFNGITNVDILPYGMSNKTETKRLYLHGNTTAFSLTQMGQNIPFEEIEVITVDDLFKLGRIDGKIDLFKVDPEGEEGKIFTSDAFKRNMDKFPVIVGEWHPWCETSQGQFMTMFRDYGYQFNYIPNMAAAVYTAVRIK